MILYTIRDNVDPKYYPTCQFPARSMPQNGLLPFVQSFVCSIGNPCDPLSEYEEVPSYKNATLVLSLPFFFPTQQFFHSRFGKFIFDDQSRSAGGWAAAHARQQNDSFRDRYVAEQHPTAQVNGADTHQAGNQSAVRYARTSYTSFANFSKFTWNLCGICVILDRGVRLGDLFHNQKEIKNLLRLQMPYAREGLIDQLFDSSIKLIYVSIITLSNYVIRRSIDSKRWLIEVVCRDDFQLIEAFGSSNIDGVICSSESLKKYLILPNDEDYEEISKIFCKIDSSMIPNMLENLAKHLDFFGLLEMVDRVMAKFRDYDFFEDLKRAVETILDLRTVNKYIPSYLKIRQWMPKMIMVFKNVTFKQIDLTLWVTSSQRNFFFFFVLLSKGNR